VKALFESWRRFNESSGCQSPLEPCYYKRTVPAPGIDDKKYFHLALQHAKALLIEHDPAYRSMLEMADIHLYNSINSLEHMSKWFALDKKGKDTKKKLELSADEEKAAAIPAIKDKTGGSVYGSAEWDAGIDLSIGNLISRRDKTFNSKSLKNFPAKDKRTYTWAVCVISLSSILVHEFYHLNDHEDPELPTDEEGESIEGIYVGDLARPHSAYSKEESILNMIPRETRAFRAQADFLDKIAVVLHHNSTGSDTFLSNMIKALATSARNYKVKWNYGQ
jgi:hypothetical protein